jgi:hypothetical protein
MKVNKVKPQTTFRQGTGMVKGEWVEAREKMERVNEHRLPLSVSPGVCCFLIDRKRVKVRDMCNRQHKKTVRGVFFPAPWKEKRAARAQGGIQNPLNLVPYVASISTISCKNVFYWTFKWGMIPSLLVDWSNRAPRGLTNLLGGRHYVPESGLLNGA